MHVINWTVTVLLALLLVACGGGSGGSTAPQPAPPPTPAPPDGNGAGEDSSGDIDLTDACEVPTQIDFVEAVTDSWYLWYDEMATVDKSEYDSAQAYLDARLQPLINEGRDRGFSYMTTITEDETSIGSGAYVGFGLRTAS